MNDSRRGLYVQLLEGADPPWDRQLASEETDHLWYSLADLIVGPFVEEFQDRLLQYGLAGPSPDGPTPQASVLQSRIVDLRIAQKYWGVGVFPGVSLSEVATWSGASSAVLVSATLSRLTAWPAEESANPVLLEALNAELLGHATRELTLIATTVTPRDFDVLRRRYGLEGRPNETLEEIAQSLGVTRERVRQIEARALRGLPDRLTRILEPRAAGQHLNHVLDEVLGALSKRPGDDVHSVQDVARSARSTPEWWPAGIFVTPESVSRGFVSDVEKCRVWLAEQNVAWLDNEHHQFVRTPSGNHNHYVNVARKLLVLVPSVSVESVRSALIQTWRPDVWRPFALNLEQLERVLASSSFRVTDHQISVDRRPSLSELNPVERVLAEVLLEHGGVASLPELRARIPGLDRAGSTESQYLYGKSPIVERLGPSIYGLRGWDYDPQQLALLKARAEADRHAWIDRGGWTDDRGEVFRYKLPSHSRIPLWIRLPRSVAEPFSRTAGPTGIVSVTTDSGQHHSLPIRSSPQGARLGPAREFLGSIGATSGCEIEFVMTADGTWHASRRTETTNDANRVSVRLGGGWVSVAY